MAAFEETGLISTFAGGRRAIGGPSFDGKPISTDISAAQIAIWNDGSLPVRAENLLTPLIIDTGGVPILEATIRRSTREVTAATLATADLAQGRVGVGWRILESGDGVLVQLTYAGAPDTPINVQGVIEGQKAIRRAEPFIRPAEPRHTFWAGRSWRTFIFIAIGMLATNVALALVDWKTDSARGKPTTRRQIAFWLLVAALLALGLVASYVWGPLHADNAPPFS